MDRDLRKAIVPRAPRYSLRIPLRYRPTGDPQWREGRTHNISRSGVLFHTDQLLPVQTPIEMLLALPAEVGGAEDSATVICRGRVVRAVPPHGNEQEPAVAVTIAGYRLAHAQSSDPRRI